MLSEQFPPVEGDQLYINAGAVVFISPKDELISHLVKSPEIQSGQLPLPLKKERSSQSDQP